MSSTKTKATADVSTIQVIRKRPSQLSKYYLWLKFYGYYYLKSLYLDYSTVAKMLLTNETRLYYIYTTREVVPVTYRNYLSRVKVDATEWALIRTVTPTGVSYTKAERF